jgi:signal transduction histidine kinase
MAGNNGGTPSQTEAGERITRLHEVAADLQGATEESVIYDTILDAAVEILGFRWCTVAVPVEGHFGLKRVSASAPLDEGDRTLPVDEGISGKTFQDGQSIIVDDVSKSELAKPVATPINSALSVPLGERGVLQGVSSDLEAFDESDREVAELLAAHATAALDRLERERELARKNERLEEFASVVSHDLRNPINVANLRLDLATDECESEHLDDVAQALQRMETLTDDLLTLARTGNQGEVTEPTDLAAVSEHSWQTVTTGNATLRTETDRILRADRSSFKQLLENLFRNSVEHGGADVTVTVGSLDDGFYVADDGSGIAASQHETVFESGHSTSDGGTGLGLSIVSDVVDAHDWEIAITESQDGGARFEITDVQFVES